MIDIKTDSSSDIQREQLCSDFVLHRYLHDKERCRQEITKILTLFSVLDVTGSGCERALEL